MALLRDVAKACGVSKSTASIALRGIGFVSPETRERIRVAAERLGYKPDPFAAAFSGRRKRRGASGRGLPIVLAVEEASQLSGTELNRMHARAAQLGYSAQTATLPEHPERLSSVLRRWYRQGVRGIMFMRPTRTLVLPTDRPEWAPFSLVSYFGDTLHVPCHSVRVDIFDSVCVCWRELWAKGYRRIGLAICRHDPELPDDEQRHAAALLVQSRLPARAPRLPIFREPLHEANNRERFLAWVERTRPDAVIGFHSGMCYWLNDAGWRVPRKLAFATLHQTGRDPSHSGYALVSEERVGFTIGLLDQLIRRNEVGWPQQAQRMVVMTRWVEGETTPSRSP